MSPNSPPRNLNPILAQVLFPVGALLALSPWLSSGSALLLGLMLALFLGNPYIELTKKMTHRLLAISVVGLGFGMNLAVVAKVGAHGIIYTVVGIFTAFVIGNILGRVFRITGDTSILITVGTAICGGSAIAAVAPVIRAKNQDVSVALGIVFTLNAIALFLFPWVGHQLELDQNQFGLWSALAIHDTSSVIGATIQYGPKAVEIGTTIKLARALWIVPVAALIGYVRSKKPRAEGLESERKARRPWFILGFLIAAAVVTVFPQWADTGHRVENLAKHLMILTLFFIGSSLTLQTLKSVGLKAFLQGIVLWLVMAVGSLAFVYYHVIN